MTLDGLRMMIDMSHGYEPMVHTGDEIKAFNALIVKGYCDEDANITGDGIALVEMVNKTIEEM
jgi:hypothetical protein